MSVCVCVSLFAEGAFAQSPSVLLVITVLMKTKAGIRAFLVQAVSGSLG